MSFQWKVVMIGIEEYEKKFFFTFLPLIMIQKMNIQHVSLKKINIIIPIKDTGKFMINISIIQYLLVPPEMTIITRQYLLVPPEVT